MRAIFGVFAVIGVCAAFSCGGGDDSAGPSSTGSNDGGGSDGVAPTEGGANEAGGGTGIAVNGTLTAIAYAGSVNGPQASRDILIIDANGNITKTSTGVDGKFTANGVVAPYDIAIPYVPLDAASGALPAYYEGITRPDPVVQTTSYDFNPSPTTRTANVSFTINACSGCIIRPSSSGGDPGFETVQTGTGSATTFTHAYQWYGDATLSTTFHFFVTTAGGVFTGYADVAATTLHDGVATSLGTQTIQALTPGGSLTASGAAPSGFDMPEVSIAVFHPDGSRVFSQNVNDTTGTVNLPI